MKPPTEIDGICFVYDGACPLCSSAAQALRIKEAYGTLRLIDARAAADDPLLAEITRRGLDLDEGMVIYADGRFYHGKEALTFMARYGEARNAFTAFCKSLFSSEKMAALTYPWMRGVRNRLLKRRDVGRIDNLGLSGRPIFQSVFGADWAALPAVLRKHYANRPYCDDEVVVEGSLDVMSKAPFTFAGPLMRWLGQVPLRNENNVPVTVRFQSEAETPAFQFNRRFHFPGKKPYHFRSRMIQIEGPHVIEVMRFGLAWKIRFQWDGNKVILKHRGYALQLFGHFIPVPLTLLLGQGYAEEIPVDEDSFDMIAHITHPWWGKVYQYNGRFRLIEKI